MKGSRSAAAFIVAVICLPGLAPAAQVDAEKAAAFKARAVELVSDRNYDSKASAHYIVRTDDPRLDVVKVSAFLESVWGHFEEVFAPTGALAQQKEPVEVYLFFSRYKYDRFDEELKGIGSAGVAGHYRSDLDVLGVHTEAVGADGLPGVLSHEAAHHLVTWRLYGADHAAMARWVSEGLGMYVGFTRMDAKGRFFAGEIGAQQAALFRKLPAGKSSSPRQTLEAFRKLMKSAEPGFIEDLVREEMQDAFFVEETAARYTAAWLLVHYLLHGDGGARAASFRAFMALDAQGKGSAEELYRALGMTPAELEKGFVAWVSSLKAR